MLRSLHPELFSNVHQQCITLQHVEKEARVMDNTLLWTDKYTPKTWAEIIGNNSALQSMRTWMEGPHTKPLLLVGSSGCGKTIAANMLMELYHHTSVVCNASNEEHAKQNLRAFLPEILRTVTTSNLGHQPLGVIIDEMDNLTSGDWGSLSELQSILHTFYPRITQHSTPSTRIPLICIMNQSSSRMKTMMRRCQVITFHPIATATLVAWGQSILKKENSTITRQTIQSVARYVEGDARHFLNWLHYLSFGSKILNKNQTNQTRDRSYVSIYEACERLWDKNEHREYWATYDTYMPSMIHENYVSVYHPSLMVDEMEKVAENVSYQDTFSSFQNECQEYMPFIGVLLPMLTLQHHKPFLPLRYAAISLKMASVQHRLKMIKRSMYRWKVHSEEEVYLTVTAAGRRIVHDLENNDYTYIIHLFKQGWTPKELQEQWLLYIADKPLREKLTSASTKRILNKQIHF